MDGLETYRIAHYFIIGRIANRAPISSALAELRRKLFRYSRLRQMHQLVYANDFVYILPEITLELYRPATLAGKGDVS
jgi:hypothetical protein